MPLKPAMQGTVCNLGFWLSSSALSVMVLHILFITEQGRVLGRQAPTCHALTYSFSTLQWHESGNAFGRNWLGSDVW